MRDKNFFNNYSNNSLFVNIARALTITLVVSGHMGGIFDLLGIPYQGGEIFPAYSFHMPVFIFFSGYFFKLNSSNKTKDFLVSKFNKLLIPYFIANIFYGILTSFLKNADIFTNCKDLSIFTLFIEPWLSGYQFNLNGPAWFVLFLFLTQLLYFIIKKVVYNDKEDLDKKIEFVLLIVFILIGFLSTFLSTLGFVKRNTLYWMILRVLFGIQFYHLGYIYKNFLIEKIPLTLKSFALTIFSKIIFIEIIGNYTFSMRTLLFRGEVFLPIIVSIFGIYYIAHISYFIAILINKLKFKRIRQLFIVVGQNTWSIMMHHMFINLIYDLSLRKLSLPILDYVILPILAVVIPTLWSLFYKTTTHKLKKAKAY